MQEKLSARLRHLPAGTGAKRGIFSGSISPALALALALA
jgi:hypothetical protein